MCAPAPEYPSLILADLRALVSQFRLVIAVRVERVDERGVDER